MKIIQQKNLQLIQTQSGNIYFGNLDKNTIQKEGYGVQYDIKGNLYQGEWKNDKKHGQGIQINYKGSQYLGSFQNDQKNGQGQQYLENGDIYLGQWKNEQMEGIGYLQCENGNYQYLGEFKNNKYNGYGILECQNQNKKYKYIGQFKNGFKEGIGKQIYKNGNQYVGQFLNNQPNGKGKYVWKDNLKIYEGEFVNGLMHGKGVLQNFQQQQLSQQNQRGVDIYKGSFVEGKKQGYGKYFWASGNQYKGNYLNNKRHGYGVLKWINGTYYKGEWEQGYQSGRGELNLNNGIVQKGIFKKNVLVQADIIDEELMKYQKLGGQGYIDYQKLQQEKSQYNYKKKNSFQLAESTRALTNDFKESLLEIDEDKNNNNTQIELKSQIKNKLKYNTLDIQNNNQNRIFNNKSQNCNKTYDYIENSDQKQQKQINYGNKNEQNQKNNGSKSNKNLEKSQIQILDCDVEITHNNLNTCKNNQKKINYDFPYRNFLTPQKQREEKIKLFSDSKKQQATSTLNCKIQQIKKGKEKYFRAISKTMLPQLNQKQTKQNIDEELQIIDQKNNLLMPHLKKKQLEINLKSNINKLDPLSPTEYIRWQKYQENLSNTELNKYYYKKTINLNKMNKSNITQIQQEIEQSQKQCGTIIRSPSPEKIQIQIPKTQIIRQKIYKKQWNQNSPEKNNILNNNEICNQQFNINDKPMQIIQKQLYQNLNSKLRNRGLQQLNKMPCISELLNYNQDLQINKNN